MAVPSTLGAVGEGRRGRAALLDAQRAIRDEDAGAARELLVRANDHFTRATDAIDSPLTLPARWIPLVRRQFLSARALTVAGAQLAEAGTGVSDALEFRPSGGWRVEGGRLDLDALRQAGEALESTLPFAVQARDTVEATPGTWLLPPLRDERADALDRVRAAEEGGRRAVAGLEALPSILGEKGKRRYYLAFANLSELRGTGGFLGFFAVLEAEGGKLTHLGDSGRPTDELPPLDQIPLELPEWYRQAYARYGATTLWQNINMTTDFPTVGNLLLQAVPPEFGPIDGAIQMDPKGVAVLLKQTGPVQVEGWPEPISAANVERITQHEAYLRFERDNRGRIEFIRNLVEVVFDHVLGADFPIRERTLRDLGEVVQGGHIQMYTSAPEEIEALQAVGLARGVARAENATDVLGLVTENGTGNKADWFMRRLVRYEVSLHPSTDTATATLDATIRTEAPPDGLPRYVIGSAVPDEVEPGRHRHVMILLRPPADELRAVRVDGEQAQVSSDHEGELRAYHKDVRFDEESDGEVQAEFVVQGALEGSGRHRTYRLHVLRQPVAFADDYRVRIEVPDGWTADGPTEFTGPLLEDVVLEVRLTHQPHAWLAQTAVLRPWRVAKDLIGGLFD